MANLIYFVFTFIFFKKKIIYSDNWCLKSVPHILCMEEDCGWPISVNIRLYKSFDDMECICVEALCLSCACVVADRLPGENSAHSEL